MRETWERIERGEAELARRIDELERKTTGSGRLRGSREELLELRLELAADRRRSGGFQAIARKHEPALLLLVVHYVLVSPEGERHRRRATGSGFFVTQTGLAVTIKHVLQPWKFVGAAADHARPGPRSARGDGARAS